MQTEAAGVDSDPGPAILAADSVPQSLVAIDGNDLARGRRAPNDAADHEGAKRGEVLGGVGDLCNVLRGRIPSGDDRVERFNLVGENDLHAGPTREGLTQARRHLELETVELGVTGEPNRRWTNHD